MSKNDETKKLLIDVIKKLDDYKTDLLLKEVITKLEKISQKKNRPKDKSSPKEFIKKKMKYRVEKAKHEATLKDLNKLKKTIDERMKLKELIEQKMKENRSKKD